MSAVHIQALFSKSAVFFTRYVSGSGWNSHGLVGDVLKTKKEPKKKRSKHREDSVISTIEWWRAAIDGFSGLSGKVDLALVLPRGVLRRNKRPPKEALCVRQIMDVVTARRKMGQYKGDISSLF